jgi:hypothetical protein
LGRAQKRRDIPGHKRMQMPLDSSAGWRIPDSEKMDMPLDSCAGWRGGVSVAAMGASGARHPRAVVVCGIGGSVEGAAVCRGMGCWVRRGWWSHLGQASPATLAPIACGTVALDRAQSRSAEPVVPSSWRCRTGVFVVTGETLTPPATRDCTCPGSCRTGGPQLLAVQNKRLRCHRRDAHSSGNTRLHMPWQFREARSGGPCHTKS